MMAAILNSAILDSATAILDSETLLSSLRFTQKHSHSTVTLIFKLIHSDLTWWWQPSWILPSWIHCHFEQTTLIHSNYFNLIQIHSFSLNLMMAAILNSAILDSAILHKTLSQTHSFWLNLMMSAILNSAILDSAILNKKKLHSFILTQLDDVRHLEFCHLGFSHFEQKKLHSFILTQLDDDISHLEFCHLGFSHFEQKKNFTHSFWLNLMMAAILNSSMLECGTAILDSDTLLSSLRFTQKHSHSTLTLTQTNSISNS